MSETYICFSHILLITSDLVDIYSVHSILSLKGQWQMINDPSNLLLDWAAGAWLGWAELSSVIWETYYLTSGYLLEGIEKADHQDRLHNQIKILHADIISVIRTFCASNSLVMVLGDWALSLGIGLQNVVKLLLLLFSKKKLLLMICLNCFDISTYLFFLSLLVTI